MVILRKIAMRALSAMAPLAIAPGFLRLSGDTPLPGFGKRHRQKALTGMMPHQGQREMARRRRQMAKARRWEQDNLRACVDCLHLVANDDLPDDRPQLRAEVDANWPAAEGWQLSAGDSDKDDEFSRHACECCGSRLGGSRHEIIALREITKPA